MCTGFTFSQPAPRRPASYGAAGDFAITPSWPAASVASRNCWASSGSEVASRSTRWPGGTIASSADSRSAVGFVEQVDAVEMQDVEEEHRQRLRCAGGGDIDAAVLAAPSAAAAEPRRGDLKSVRAPVGSQRDRLAVGDQVLHRQRERRLDDFGQPGGDVVEAAGVDRNVVAGAVDLDAGSVELGLENRLAAELVEGFGDPGRGLGQHRADGPTDPQRELGQRRLTAGQGGRRDGGQIAAQHRRPAHGRGGDARCLRHGVGHHPGQRALTQFAAEETPQERLLGAPLPR